MQREFQGLARRVQRQRAPLARKRRTFGLILAGSRGTSGTLGASGSTAAGATMHDRSAATGGGSGLRGFP